MYTYIHFLTGTTQPPKDIHENPQAEEALEKDPKCFLAAWEGAIAAKHIGALARTSPGLA